MTLEADLGGLVSVSCHNVSLTRPTDLAPCARVSPHLDAGTMHKYHYSTHTYVNVYVCEISTQVRTYAQAPLSRMRRTHY